MKRRKENDRYTLLCNPNRDTKKQTDRLYVIDWMIDFDGSSTWISKYNWAQTVGVLTKRERK